MRYQFVLFFIWIFVAGSYALLNSINNFKKNPPYTKICKNTRDFLQAIKNVQVINPVIIVPGDGGSQIYAKLNKSSSPHYYCYDQADWYPLWLSLPDFVPLSVDCFVDNVKLEFSSSDNKWRNTEGVETRVPGFGDTETVEFLDPTEETISATHYFAYIVDYLVANGGYERGKSVRGAPYDFRYSAEQQKEWTSNFTKLIEETYEMNGGKKVIIMAHSMGNLYSWFFMQQQGEQWVKTYVERFVSLSAPWAGAVKTIKVVTSGDNEDVHTIEPFTLREAERSWPSTYSMFPQTSVWGEEETLVTVIQDQNSNKTYSISNFSEYFDDMQFPDGMKNYVLNIDQYKDIIDKPPPVPIDCLIGVDMPTEVGYVYKATSFPDYQPETIVYNDGDGTVPRSSAQVCQHWADKHEHPVGFYTFSKAEHMAILLREDVTNLIGQILGIEQAIDNKNEICAL